MNNPALTYPWIQEAYKHIGLKEIPGPKHNPILINWLERLKAWWKDDETPWCGLLIAHCFDIYGMKIPKLWMRAKEWGNNWGTRLSAPVPGCVVVFERQGGGHVGFILGATARNELVVLGGNQSNMVNIAKFDPNRVFGYYWPRDYPLPQNGYTKMPRLEVAGGLSVNEA